MTPSPKERAQHEADLVIGLLDVLIGEDHAEANFMLEQAEKVIRRCAHADRQAKERDGVKSVKVPAFHAGSGGPS